jgi:hypothetical protein
MTASCRARGEASHAAFVGDFRSLLFPVWRTHRDDKIIQNFRRDISIASLALAMTEENRAHPHHA